jgi:hypothetical protein
MVTEIFIALELALIGLFALVIAVSTVRQAHLMDMFISFLMFDDDEKEDMADDREIR